MIYIGIDLGTTSICCVAVDTANWQIKRIKTCLNTSAIISSNPQDKKQDADKIYILAKDLIDCMFDTYNQIGGIAISCQMHGILYVDESGNAVSPLYTWQHHEAAAISTLSQLPYYKELENKLGRNCPPGYGLATHYTLQSKNQIPAQAKKLCSIGDYVGMKLCGNKIPFSDITLSESYGAVFLGEKDYNKERLDSAAIDINMLPPIVEADTIIGNYKKVPVVTAIGDNQASFLGAVRNLNSNAVISLGTSGQITCYSDRLITVAGVETRPFLKNGFILSGASLCGGYAYALLERFFDETITWLCGDILENKPNIYKKLDEISPLNFDNFPAVKTLFFGTRVNPEMNASISGIDANNFLPQNLTAGIVVGIIKELKEFFDLFPDEIRKNILELYGSGSFFNKHPFVPACCENIFHLSVKKTNCDEEAAFGAAISMGIALNNFSSYNDAILRIKALNDDSK